MKKDIAELHESGKLQIAMQADNQGRSFFDHPHLCLIKLCAGDSGIFAISPTEFKSTTNKTIEIGYFKGQMGKRYKIYRGPAVLMSGEPVKIGNKALYYIGLIIDSVGVPGSVSDRGRATLQIDFLLLEPDYQKVVGIISANPYDLLDVVAKKAYPKTIGLLFQCIGISPDYRKEGIKILEGSQKVYEGCDREMAKLFG